MAEKTKDKKKSQVEQLKFKRGEVAKIILAVLGVGVVLGGSVFITPNFPIVLGGLIQLIEEIKGIKIPKLKLKRTLKRLEERKIIDLQRKGNELYVKVKDRWNIEIVKYSIESLLELKKKKKWLGKWFLIVFDVPEKERNKRDYLRNLLKEIGFYQYKQSIYIYPYECEKEVALLKKVVEGGKYLSYLVAEKVEREQELKTFFKLN